MNYYKEHQKLLKQVLKALQKMYPSGRFFQRHVGMFFTANGIPIKINTKGMSDLWGIINGIHIEIEIKTGKARQTEDQKNWESAIKKMGSHYFVIRSIKDLEQIKETLQNPLV